MPALCHWNLKMIVSMLPWVAGFCATWFGFVFIWETSNNSGFHTFCYILYSGCFINCSELGIFLVFWLYFCVCIDVCVCVVGGLFRWLSGERICLQCGKHRRCGFDLWIGKIPWRRKWQLTPVFLSGEFHGQGSLVGYSPWVGVTESDTNE